MSYVSGEVNNELFEAHLLVIGYESEAKYEIENVKTTFLNKKRVLTGIPAMTLFLFKFRPSIVISSLGHLNTALGLVAPLFINTKFIVREASVPGIMSKYSSAGKMHGKLARIAYKNIHAVVCQSKDMAIDFESRFKIPSSIIHIINNPITKIFPVKTTISEGNNSRFITVGRLSEEKGHLRILKILSKVSSPFQYTIIGDGAERETIFKKAEELGISQNITHIPFTNKVSEELSKHDIFLQGSYVEGFPNAVVESLVVGTPVLAFEAPGGTKEIIQNGVNGFIVNNENEFLEKLELMRATKWDPEAISLSVKRKFNKEKILSHYENLFLKLHAK